jgi:hypothetical protein
MAWSTYKTPAKKRFMVVQTYMTTDGNIQPIIDINVDYNSEPGVNTPDTNLTQEGAAWETGVWDEDYWTVGERTVSIWNGVAQWGQVGAVRFTAQVQNAQLSVSGWDVVYEAGMFGG